MTDPSSFMHSNEPPGRHGPCYKIYDHDQLGNSLEGLAGMILLEFRTSSFLSKVSEDSSKTACDLSRDFCGGRLELGRSWSLLF